MLMIGGMNIFYPLENLFLSHLMTMVFRIQIVSIFLKTQKKTKIFSKSKFPSGFVTNYLLNDYVVKMGTIIIKKRIAKLYKFNQNYNIIGDFDFILRVSEKFKAKAFNDLLVTIRIHQNNFSHTNRKLFYNEFKSWIKSKNLE